MSNVSGHPRIDSASRIIMAAPHKIYQAFLDPEAVRAWRPPAGMEARIYAFNPYEGGIFRMAFRYKDAGHAVQGKTSANEDVFEGRFLELVPDKRIVELVTFESDDPAFAGEMRITTTLDPIPGGAKVTISCEQVPEGIKPEDHQAGITSSLINLAAFTE